MTRPTLTAADLALISAEPYCEADYDRDKIYAGVAFYAVVDGEPEYLGAFPHVNYGLLGTQYDADSEGLWAWHLDCEASLPSVARAAARLRSLR